MIFLFPGNNIPLSFFQAAKPSYFPVEKGMAAVSKPDQKKFL
ncbi:hypothetical protein AB434_3957 [Heyndrickxia coagulans]|uniref:Uncharacterized protein n=1 Tax=Heyndrickxia coagulans TaxID=1398 RepID=A0A0C5CL37_HEYCO|nr:hypothetical protein SB48_HM08orf02025 [Heyndrickxia coagulans]AKN56362.1 hypothetical protein AB434_3957 [Heyndrickxia coagulans]KWZ76451.1 hypothetical protein HMPREF3213_03822 [Heyndrickxia coagulans]